MGSTALDTGSSLTGLPERGNVPWRRQVDPQSLERVGRRWTHSTVAQTLPIVLTGLFFMFLGLVPAIVGLILLVHAWAIPELYAHRGAGVLRSRGRAGAAAEQRALLLLGDLVRDDARRLYDLSGLVIEGGEFGVWLLAEAGAVLMTDGGRRVYCYCIKARGTDLPVADRIAHLLLALRCQERDFVTVANLAFSGAPWRLRRRLSAEHQIAFDVARRAALPDQA